MGEAILVKAGGLGVDISDPEDKNIVSWELKTELITQSQQFIVPKAKDQQFSVRLFGGGGGTCAGYIDQMFPSGSGNMNFAQLKLKKLDIIPITIGVAGRNNSGEAGGTTSFGTYLSATGGGLPDIPNHIGAPGGIGGEGFVKFTSKYVRYDYSELTPYYTHAGISTYGGGSGGLYLKNTQIQCQNNTLYIHGANGGIYGGGGGTTHDQTPRIGGNDCGNGGNGITDATKGKNTIGSLEEFVGFGEVNTVYFKNLCGGGGYGGNSGKGKNVNYSSSFNVYNESHYACGGGGGYGANGSNGVEVFNNSYVLLGADNGGHSGGRGGGYGGSGGYGSSNYSSGYSGLIVYGNNSKSIRYFNAKNGIAIISYYSPVYKN